MKRIVWITGLLIVLAVQVKGQEPASRSKKAIEYYNRGLQQYTMNEFASASEYLTRAVEEDSSFVKAWLILAQVYEDWKQPSLAIATYRKVLSVNAGYYLPAHIFLARLEYNQALYRESLDHYRQFLAFPGEKNEKLVQKAQEGVSRCEFAIHAIENPVEFSPVSLGPAVNTTDDEYWPSISADEQTLVITRMVKASQTFGNKQEDFYISQWTDQGWGPMKNAGYPLNSSGNEGAQSISADGRIMVFTGCNRKDGLGRCDLYISKRVGDTWTIPVNMDGPVNTSYTETQPSLSADGKTLYFASDRPGGSGSVDLWVCHQGENDKWTKPVNLGDTINSPGNEMSPFIHPDGQTLYLASDGHIGLGGYDIFVCRLDSSGKWTEPENLGYPINTNRDEFGLIVNPSGNRAYFASNLDPDMGRDIYYFNLPEILRPEVVSFMKGIVYDSETKQRLGADFELIDLNTRSLISQSLSDPITGEFLVCIPTHHNYLLNVSKKGYLFFSENFSMNGIFLSGDPYLKDVPLHPVRAGESVVLRNIFYETDAYALKSESMVELDRLIRFLEDNPLVRIEICGHTDNVGSPEYNLILSDNRSKAVADYLVQEGVNRERLVCRGYGMSQPVAGNETEEDRAKNRRTEIRIIE